MSADPITLPVTFTAIGCTALAAPLERLTRTVNVLQADEVLIRVSYASINPTDWKIYQSNFVQLPLPMVLGYDCAGVVVALGTTGGVYAGEESEQLTVGAAVMGSAFGIKSDSKQQQHQYAHTHPLSSAERVSPSLPISAGCVAVVSDGAVAATASMS